MSAQIPAYDGEWLDEAATRERLGRTWSDAPGLWGWLTTLDHKRIGLRYIVTAFGFFVLAGLAAFVMRLQLVHAENDLVGPDLYNQLFTMHGSTMMFLFAVPFMEAIANYLLPVMLGTRELPFPRMTAFGYWTYVAGGLLFYSAFLFGLEPDAGWYAYVPFSGNLYSPSIRIDFWLLGLSVAEVAAIGAGIELTVAQQVSMLLLLMVTSKGMAGVPRASLVVIMATLTYFGMDEAWIALVLAVDHLLDMGRSATNVVGNSVASAVVSRWEGKRGKDPVETPDPMAG